MKSTIFVLYLVNLLFFNIQINKLLCPWYSCTLNVHLMPVFMVLKKECNWVIFFLVNDEHIRCLIAWDYTFIRALAEGRFSHSWEAFCLLHNDSCSCSKYTRNLKGLIEEGEPCFSRLFFQTQWMLGHVRNHGVSLLRVLLSWDLGLQISNTCTHVHTIGSKELAGSEVSCLLTYWGGAGPSVVFPDLQLLHLSWDQPLFQSKRNPEKFKKEYTRIKVKLTVSWSGIGWKHRGKKNTHPLSISRYLLALYIPEIHFWHKGY